MNITESRDAGGAGEEEGAQHTGGAGMYFCVRRADVRNEPAAFLYSKRKEKAEKGADGTQRGGTTEGRGGGGCSNNETKI